jgi:dTDP-4-amino-4,6-dideoxygalactose transaminase
VKLRHLDAWNDARRRHAAAYDRLLASREDVVRIPDADGNLSAYHLYVIRVKDRDARLARLHAAGIGAGIHYPIPVHRLDAYRALASDRFPEADAWAAECLSLPLYPELTEAQVERVVAAL